MKGCPFFLFLAGYYRKSDEGCHCTLITFWECHQWKHYCRLWLCTTATTNAFVDACRGKLMWRNILETKCPLLVWIFYPPRAKIFALFFLQVLFIVFFPIEFFLTWYYFASIHHLALNWVCNLLYCICNAHFGFHVCVFSFYTRVAHSHDEWCHLAGTG